MVLRLGSNPRWGTTKSNRRIQMAVRKFRTEYLKMKCADGWVAAKFIGNFDGSPNFDAVFYDESDGCYYSFRYANNSDVGIDSFEGLGDDETFECVQVMKKVVESVEWVKA